MEYAIQLLLPIVGGLLLGVWLNQHLGWPPIWTVILAVLGMVGGIGILYKRFSNPELYPPSTPSATKPSQPTEPSHSVPIEDLDFLYREHADHPGTDPHLKEFDEE